MKCDECLPRIEEYIDGELDGRTGERLAAHLSTCVQCAEEFAELRREAEIYGQYRRDLEVTPAQWNIVRARIEQEKDARSQKPATSLRERLGVLFGSERKSRPVFALALLLIVASITAGVVYLNSRQQEANIVSQPPAASQKIAASVDEDGKAQTVDSGKQKTAPVANNATGTAREKKSAVVRGIPLRARNPSQVTALSPGTGRKSDAGGNARVQDSRDSAFDSTLDFADTSVRSANFTTPARSLDFESEIARHVERAELLLRSFRNVRLPIRTPALDISYEKEQSRKLLYRNIALRRDATTRGDRPTAELLDKLEPILLDIANLPNRARARDVRSIEERMEKKEIVATLQVRTLVAAN
jgi:anti-sigma factor RsiW